MLATRTIPIALLIGALASWPSGSEATRPAAAPQPPGHNALEDAYVWLAASLDTAVFELLGATPPARHP